VILGLIARTTTAACLTVDSYPDSDPCPAGVTDSDAEKDALRIERDVVHGEWNDTIRH
jgi:hypothetical protein